MIKFNLALLMSSLLHLGNAMAWVPVHLIDIDSQARSEILKQYITLSNITSDQLTHVRYRKLTSEAKQSGKDWGVFSYYAEISVSPTSKAMFICKTTSLRIQFNQNLKKIEINQANLKNNSTCSWYHPGE